MLNSRAEDEIVRIVRDVSSQAGPQKPLDKWYDRQDSGMMVIRNALSASLPVTIVARNFSGWWNGQGEMINVVMNQPTTVENEVITKQTLLNVLFKTERQYLVFLDTQKTLKLENFGMMARLNRDLIEIFLRLQQDSFHINQKITDALKVLPPSTWNTQWIKINDHLTVVVVKPCKIKEVARGLF
jgi:hypothetical protein